MQQFRGGLVFWYQPGRTVTIDRTSGRAYSALTQAYYMDQLSQTAIATGAADLQVAAEGAFKSLLVPTTRGGVMTPGKLGPVLQEAPQSVPSAILNGWLSALQSLKHYAARTGSAEARAVLLSSAHEVARRLGRYDLPAVLGTAYSGFGYARLRFDVPPGTAVAAAALNVDGRLIPLRLNATGDASDIVHVVACGARDGRAIVTTCSGLLLDVPVTSAGIAGTCILQLTLRAPDGDVLRGSVSRGVYRFAHDRGRAVVGWTGRQVVPEGRAVRLLSLPWSAAQIKAALTPTTFKRYGDHRVNVYHEIHIARLRELAAEGGAAFPTYATRWRSYMCHWAGDPAYRLLPPRDLTCPAAQ
jgi:hypothetical protein